jgi:hypothetical protein
VGGSMGVPSGFSLVGAAEDDEGRRSGETGLVVNECGDGAVGGGRWMNVSPSSGRLVIVAFGFS